MMTMTFTVTVVICEYEFVMFSNVICLMLFYAAFTDTFVNAKQCEVAMPQCL